MYILHIVYAVQLCPDLDHEIFGILGGTYSDLDLMRDDIVRDIFMYYDNDIEVEAARELLLEVGQKNLNEEDDREITLLDLIRIFIYKKDSFQTEKLKLRRRINQIYIKHKLGESRNGQVKEEQEKGSEDEESGSEECKNSKEYGTENTG